LKTFREAIHTQDFVITATLPIRQTTIRTQIQKHIDGLKPLVHAIQVGDNWDAEGHMDVLAIASLLLQQNIDPVVHLSCRDRNRLALQGSLLGAAGLGVTSLLLSRGQKLPERLRGRVKGVFDTKPAQLFELAQRIGKGSDELNDGGFHVGTAAPAMNPKEGWRAAKIHQRIDAGVRFVQIRPCLNIEMLRSYMHGIVGLKLSRRAAFIVDLPILGSIEAAQELRASHPGVRIPKKLISRIAVADDPRRAAIEVSAEALGQMASIPGLSGVNILYDGDPTSVADVINAAGIGS